MSCCSLCPLKTKGLPSVEVNKQVGRGVVFFSLLKPQGTRDGPVVGITHCFSTSVGEGIITWVPSSILGKKHLSFLGLSSAQVPGQGSASTLPTDHCWAVLLRSWLVTRSSKSGRIFFKKWLIGGEPSLTALVMTHESEPGIWWPHDLQSSSFPQDILVSSKNPRDQGA